MTNLEQKLHERIRNFPPEKQLKMLEYADVLEEAETGDVEEFPTLWDIVKDFVEKVPEDVFDEIPSDASINVDHYLYGHSKKEQ